MFVTNWFDSNENNLTIRSAGEDKISGINSHIAARAHIKSLDSQNWCARRINCGRCKWGRSRSDLNGNWPQLEAGGCIPRQARAPSDMPRDPAVPVFVVVFEVKIKGLGRPDTQPATHIPHRFIALLIIGNWTHSGLILIHCIHTWGAHHRTPTKVVIWPFGLPLTYFIFFRSSLLSFSISQDYLLSECASEREIKETPLSI